MTLFKKTKSTKTYLHKFSLAVTTSAALALVGFGCGGVTPPPPPPPDTKLWIADELGMLGYVDINTGELVVIGDMGVTITDIAFNSAGELYGISFDDLYLINTATAETTLIGNHSALSETKNSLVFGPGDVLYAASTNLYTIDTNTADSTLVGNGGSTYGSSGDLAFFGSKLYLTSGDGPGIDSLLELSLADGSATEIGELGFDTAFGLASNKVNLYSVTGTAVHLTNVDTAETTLVIDYGGQSLGIAYGTAFSTEAMQ